MAGGFDLYGYALATGVIALIGWYFWHVGASLLKNARLVNAFLDTRAARQRAALDHEALHGPPPLWLKAARIAAIGSLVACLAVLFWMRLPA